MKAGLNSECGQAMVEFIIVLPVLLLLILGTLQFAFIYQAKITLNYAAFEAARAGSLNNAEISAMEDAFANAMAALYNNAPNSDSYIEARQVVRDQIEDGYVNIRLISPSAESFANYSVRGDLDGDGNDERYIPNDNLMYRDSALKGTQSIQDANLLKVHLGYCYELYVPFVNRILWLMQRYGPGEAPAPDQTYGRWWIDDGAPPGFFGPPTAGSFAESCIRNPTDADRLSIVLYSQGIMRMQSPALDPSS